VSVICICVITCNSCNSFVINGTDYCFANLLRVYAAHDFRDDFHVKFTCRNVIRLRGMLK